MYDTGLYRARRKRNDAAAAELIEAEPPDDCRPEGAKKLSGFFYLLSSRMGHVTHGRARQRIA